MECPNCRMNIDIRRSFCPHCGRKVEVEFDAIASSVHVDAAVRRGRRIEQGLTFAVLGVVLAGVVVWCVNDYFQFQVRFDEEFTPYVAAPAAGVGEVKSAGQAYAEPFALRPFGEAPTSGFGQRQEPFRGKLRMANGGDARTEKAVSLALSFLQRKQTLDGSWPLSAAELPIDKTTDKTSATQWGRVGVSALALLAFFGDGHTWAEGGGAPRSQYANAVKNGVSFLLGQQDAATGRVGPADGNFMYNHGMATLALAEAFGLTGDPVVQEAASKAVAYSVRHQRQDGGWDYTERAGLRVDTSVSAWHTQALVAARQAGLNVPQEALDRALSWYVKATDERGIVAYDSNIGRETFPSMLGVALMLRQMLGEPLSAPRLRDTREKLAAYFPHALKNWGENWKPTDAQDAGKRAVAFDLYRWYFMTYGQFFAGGAEWKRWNEGLKEAMLVVQNKDGSFRPNDEWSKYGGVVYSTALGALCLQVYYRYP